MSAAGGMVDIHCHVLPGVDDGSPDLETSLEFLRCSARSGVVEVIATPHQHPGRYPNEPPPLQAAHQALTEALTAARAGATEELPGLHLGAEVHLDVGLPEAIASGRRLTLAGGRYLLLELPDLFTQSVVEELVFQLQLMELVPILAHPERCGPFLREPARLHRLVELGALAQVTANSVTGAFGEPCRVATEGFLRRRLVHFVASDAHDLERRTPSLAEARTAVDELLGPEVGRSLFEDNPRAVIEGRPIDPPPPLAEADGPRRSWLGRLLASRRPPRDR